MSKSDTIFVDIDTQNDFLDNKGSLYILQSENIRINLAKLINFAVKNDITLISTMDSHSENDPEFREFRPHGIPGTWGWQKIPETTYDNYQIIEPQEINHLELKTDKFIIKKPQISAFSNPNTMKLIKALNKRNFVVFGVATDYCVKQFTLGLLKENFLVQLVEDAIAGINDLSTEYAIVQMVNHGAKLVKTEEIISKLEEK